MSKKIVTSCQKCVFSEVTGNTQIGCAAGQLDIYPHVPAYNEEGEFYLVEDICMFHRTKEWANNESDINEMLKLADKELTINYNAFIYAASMDMFQINKTINSLREQKNRPQKVILAVYGLRQEDFPAYQEILNDFGAWQLEDLVEEENPVQFYFRSIFHHTNKWFLLVNGGNVLPDGWIDDCNDKIKTTRQHYKFHIDKTAVFAPTSLFDLVIPEVKDVSCVE